MYVYLYVRKINNFQNLHIDSGRITCLLRTLQLFLNTLKDVWFLDEAGSYIAAVFLSNIVKLEYFWGPPCSFSRVYIFSIFHELYDACLKEQDTTFDETVPLTFLSNLKREKFPFDPSFFSKI